MDSQKARINLITNRSLAIQVTNPKWGVNKETGKYSKSHILTEKMITESAIPSDLRDASISFRSVINGDSTKQLDKWISSHENSVYKKIRSFVSDIKKDIQSVRNAILFSWTNGLTEGCVNRLKNKKREMYGRAGFDLLRIKVCLSVSG